MLFWMRSKTYMSKINLQRGKLTVENRKSREKKRICSEVSVNSYSLLCGCDCSTLPTVVWWLTAVRCSLLCGCECSTLPGVVWWCRSSRGSVLVVVQQAAHAALQHHGQQVLRPRHRRRHRPQRHYHGTRVLPHAKSQSALKALCSSSH